MEKVKKSSILPIILIIYGVFVAYRGVFSLWKVDSDIAVFPVMIRYFLTEGWSALKTFHFPIDNWFFSIIIPYGIVFHFFGEQSTLLLVLGAVVFCLTAFFAGLLVFKLSSLNQGLWCGALILAAPQIALGRGGFLLYSVAHNASMLWGLFGVLLCFLSIRKQNIFFLILSGVVFSLSSFSDPWMLPVFVLPIIISSFIMFFLESGRKRLFYTVWFFIGLFVIIFSETHCLGLFPISAIYKKGFTSVNLSWKSIIFTSASVSYYFNFIPLLNFNNFYSILLSEEKRNILLYYIAMVINFFIFFSIVYALIRSIKRKYIFFERENLFVFILFILSILGIFSASVVFKGVNNIRLARYIVNIYYALIICVCLLPWKSMDPSIRKKFYALGFLFLSASILSNKSVWKGPALLSSFDVENEVISFLNNEQIQYAYGDYWGVEAHTITWKSHYEKVVRPLLYTMDYHGFLPTIWTSPNWYHVPSSQKWVFVLTNLGDDRVCPPYPSCREAVLNQFGSPLYIKQKHQVTFFVYAGNKMNLPYDINVENWKKPLSISYDSVLSWKDFYPEIELNGNNLISVDGWEWAKHGVVTTEEYATVHVPVLDRSSTLVRMWVHLSSNKMDQLPVDVLYRGKVVAQWVVPSHESIYYLELPIEPGQNSLDYQFHILNYKAKQKPVNGIRMYRVKVLDHGG
ncbi:hypothetical protein GM556_07805 [Bombella sp. ESL0378]|uniref:hypothetical protein n=1 Tax=Bombella sp. ESL0378 TaxID=2676442 RepID=UPI0012D96D1C|nr:hypothetical protein [Bombella sp. ESL0378]MUG05439.1 hypothetical protein [Bombella sp. ESL0378]